MTRSQSSVRCSCFFWSMNESILTSAQMREQAWWRASGNRTDLLRILPFVFSSRFDRRDRGRPSARIRDRRGCARHAGRDLFLHLRTDAGAGRRAGRYAGSARHAGARHVDRGRRLDCLRACRKFTAAAIARTLAGLGVSVVFVCMLKLMRQLVPRAALCDGRGRRQCRRHRRRAGRDGAARLADYHRVVAKCVRCGRRSLAGSPQWPSGCSCARLRLRAAPTSSAETGGTRSRQSRSIRRRGRRSGSMSASRARI